MIDILIGDCRESMRKLPANSVHTCVTSPPYFGLRDYGHEDQLGLEATPDAFVAAMVDVFREVRRVLRDDGTLWLNIGDSYARNPSKGGSGPGGKNETQWGYGVAQNAKVSSFDGVVGRADRPGTRATGWGLKEKDLIGIPWMLAFALRADGWYLRQDIIWHKPNPMPESVNDRCTKSHEHIFLLSKSPKYYFDADAIKEPLAASSYARSSQDIESQRGSSRVPGKTNGTMKAVRFGGNKYGKDQSESSRTKSGELWQNESGVRNKRDVWLVTTKPFKGAHFATFPPDLIEPCVLAGAPEGGTVLDPFGGAGTTALVARKHNRRSVLCELNPAYGRLARQRLGIETLTDKLQGVVDAL